MMQKMGLEPTRYCYHRHLKPARLPIPPLLLDLFYLLDTIGILHYFYVEVKHILKFFLKNFTGRKIPFIPCKAEHLFLYSRHIVSNIEPDLLSMASPAR